MKWAVLAAALCAVAVPAGADEVKVDRTLAGSAAATEGLQIGGLARPRLTGKGRAMAVLALTSAAQTASSGTK